MSNNNTETPSTGVPTPQNTGADGKQADSLAVSNQRRKLIKTSALAVPAIMTLRSGAAAAAASMNICTDIDADRAAIELGDNDNVLGDGPNELALDEWVRVTGKAGKQVTATVNGTQGVYYGVLLLDLSFAYYDSAGTLITNNGEINQIESGTATNFYCVSNGGGWDCVGEDAVPLTTVPADIMDDGKDVYLLVYYAPSVNGMPSGATYYPHIDRIMDQQANPITGSCLASVDPDFNIMG